MAGYIKFRSIVYDTMVIRSEEKSYSLFNDEILDNSNPINENSEKMIVRWLFSNKNFVQLFNEELGFRFVCQPLFEVPRDRFRQSPEKKGDFDVVFCKNGKFEEVTCIEFKRIKVEQTEYEGREKINGLSNIGRLIHQGNLVRKTGFHETYIAAVALVDTSKFVRPNIMTKFEPTSEYKKLYEIGNFGELDSDVGFILIEIEQPTGKDYNKKGMINIVRLRASRNQEQSSKVTEDFKNIFNARQAKLDI